MSINYYHAIPYHIEVSFVTSINMIQTTGLQPTTAPNSRHKIGNKNVDVSRISAASLIIHINWPPIKSNLLHRDVVEL